MVLRRFPPGDDAAAREAAVLAALDGLEGWAPRLLDADPAGRRSGEPALLITRLSGRADLTSVSAQAAAEQLGRVLARIMSLLHGPDSAEMFLRAYGQAAETVPDLVLWDLFAVRNSHRSVETWLPNYHDLGRTDLTAADLRERHTSRTQECLGRYRSKER